MEQLPMSDPSGQKWIKAHVTPIPETSKTWVPAKPNPIGKSAADSKTGDVAPHMLPVGEDQKSPGSASPITEKKITDKSPSSASAAGKEEVDIVDDTSTTKTGGLFTRVFKVQSKQNETSPLPTSFDGTDAQATKGYGEKAIKGAYVVHDQYLKEGKDEDNNDRVGVVTLGKRTYVTVTDAPGSNVSGTIPASLLSKFFMSVMKKAPSLSGKSLTAMAEQAVDPKANKELSELNKTRTDFEQYQSPTGITLGVERTNTGMNVAAACAGDTNCAIIQENGTSQLLFKADPNKSVGDPGGGFSIGDKDQKGIVKNLVSNETSVKGKAVVLVGSDSIFDNIPTELMFAIIRSPTFDTVPTDKSPTDYDFAPKAKNAPPFDIPFPRHYTKEEFEKKFPGADDPFKLLSDEMQNVAVKRLKNFMEWEKAGYLSTEKHVKSKEISRVTDYSKSLRTNFTKELETYGFGDHKIRNTFSTHIAFLKLNADQTGLSNESIIDLNAIIKAIDTSALTAEQKASVKTSLVSAVEVQMLVCGLQYAVWGKPDDRTLVCVAHTELKK